VEGWKKDGVRVLCDVAVFSSVNIPTRKKEKFEKDGSSAKDWSESGEAREREKEKSTVRLPQAIKKHMKYMSKRGYGLSWGREKGNPM